MGQALRLVLFDATQRGRKPRGLGLSWQLGAQLYRGLDRVDASFGAHSFESALDWLASYEPTRPIAELQYWGHGKWGRVFNLHALSPGAAPHWSKTEGLARGTPEKPILAHASSPNAPHTISCLTGKIPPHFAHA